MNFLPDVEHVASKTQLQGALQKSGVQICELLIKLATFWPGATRGLGSGLFSGIRALRTSGFPIHTYIHTYIHMWFAHKTGQFWLGAAKHILEAFFANWSPSTERLPNV